MLTYVLEFLNTAELADTDFTAGMSSLIFLKLYHNDAEYMTEKTSNLKIIHKDQVNSYLLTADEEKAAKTKHRQNKQQLTVPRRPHWDSTTTPAELERREKDSFLHWRRGLAELQETKDLLMTPFERNLEVWRQLWRVIERSDLIVQIVDARNPLMFRSEDLERYVKEVDERKNNLLLVNKADMMTAEQRSAWADYFEKEGISYRFFSAALAKQINEEYYSEDEEEKPVEEVVEEEKEEPRIRILTVNELEEVFLEHAPIVEGMFVSTLELYIVLILPQTKTQRNPERPKSVLSDTRTLGNLLLSMPLLVQRRCPSPRPPEKQNTSKPSTLAKR